MKFFGMKEPDFDVPLIEIETVEGQVVDLYNESDLRSVVRRGDELVFEFDPADGYGSLSTMLRFIGVRELRIAQPEDWHPGEGDQIEHLLVRRPGHWPRIVFKAGGLDYEFNATELRAVATSTPA